MEMEDEDEKEAWSRLLCQDTSSDYGCESTTKMQGADLSEVNSNSISFSVDESVQPVDAIHLGPTDLISWLRSRTEVINPTQPTVFRLCFVLPLYI